MRDYDLSKIRDKDYKDKDGYTDHAAMAWDYLKGNNGFKEHTLSDVLKDMGFPENSFMVVKKIIIRLELQRDRMLTEL